MEERLKIGQWVLERQLGWVTAAEVKVGVIIAIDTALLGALVAAIGISTIISWTIIVYIFTITTIFFALLGIFFSAMAILPRTKGPECSLFFFGKIAQLEKEEYTNQFCSTCVEKLLQDVTEQIHRNAEIACAKYTWVKRSLYCSLIAIIPWIVSIFLLVKCKN